ncbi:Major facilitator superfamily domain general substrate transporter [Penicillium cf. griseofulvum]|nr:Major facilitator superfamily domain general substrate transporter [Penicillium cf. griseofulvum]
MTPKPENPPLLLTHSQLETYYNLSYTIVSLVFLSPFLGYTAAALLNERVHCTVGQRGVAFISSLCHLIAYILNCVHPPYPVLVVSFIFAGLGNGLADSAWNAWIGNLVNPNQLLGLLHGFYGVGAVISPLIASLLVADAGLPWYYFYYIMIGGAAIELVVCVACFWRSTGESFRLAKKQQPGGSSEKAGLWSVLSTMPSARITWTCAIFLLGYVGVEVALGGWVVTFMKEVRHAAPFSSSMTSIGFWLGITVGRVILGFITPLIGEKIAITSLPPNAKPWWKTTHLIHLNSLIASLILFSSTLGYDISLMNSLQSLPQWQTFMSYPEGIKLGFINALQNIASMLFLPVQAWSANRFGRKPTILAGYIFMILGVGLQSASQNPNTFIYSRVLVGIAGAWFQCAVVLVTEIAYPGHRSLVTAIYMCQYYAGSSLSAWISFAMRDVQSNWAWRVPVLMQIALPLLALPGTLRVPESPRWLISCGRVEEARGILVRFHAGGDEGSQLVGFEMEEISQGLALERKARREARWIDCVRTSGNRYRLFLSVSLGVFAQWNGGGVVSYYLTLILDTIGITSSTDQTLINGFLQLWNLVMSVVGACLVDRAGRRALFITSTVIMLISYIFITALSGSFVTTGTSAVGTAVIPFLFIYYAGYDIAFTPLLLAYPAEIWTTSLRAKGVAISMMSNYIALIFNQLINPIAFERISWKYYFVFLVVLLVVLVVVWKTYPETRGRSLEEIACIFDRKEVHVTYDAKMTTEERHTGKIEHREM